MLLNCIVGVLEELIQWLLWETLDKKIKNIFTLTAADCCSQMEDNSS